MNTGRGRSAEDDKRWLEVLKENNVDNEWKPIAPLSESERRIDVSDVNSLKESWLEFRQRLGESRPQNLAEFIERLTRKWSIETGILERIYDIDRGTTIVLIERGFFAGLVERSGTDKEPEQLVEVLRDHKAAADLVQDCVASSRPLTVGLIHELHAILTSHQVKVEGVDQFGTRVALTPRRGAFKEQPNNPTRPDGSQHRYCPPIHVASEMDNLIKWHNEYSDVDPVIAAAWWHHRFTQIHPYQDGNGRVARALTNLILVKGGLFPVVVTRDQRSPYISALEKADDGDLGPLVRLFAAIEKATMLEALSIGPDIEPSKAVIEGVTEAIATKLKRRKEDFEQRLRRVNEVAEVLQNVAGEHMRKLSQRVVSQINATSEIGMASQVILGGPEMPHNGRPTEHWYHFQVVQSAQAVRRRINFKEHHYFVRTRLSSPTTPWLTFIVSFHHVGEELSGVMEATTFSEISFPPTEQEPPKTEHVECMDEPFTFTNKDDPDRLKRELLNWVGDCFAVAVKRWGDVL